MIPRTRTHAAALAVVLLLAGFGVGRCTAGESCASWRDRYTNALSHAINGTADARRAVSIVLADRPASCNR